MSQKTEEEKRLRKIQKKHRCEHLHLSGRRCGQPSPVNTYCGLHKSGLVKDCRECVSMMDTFKPLRGW